MAEVYADLSRAGGVDVGVQTAAANDPGEGAFAAYAGAAHNERVKEEAMLVNLILSDPDGGGSQKSPVGSMFSSEMLSALSASDVTPRR